MSSETWDKRCVGMRSSNRFPSKLHEVTRAFLSSRSAINVIIQSPLLIAIVHNDSVLSRSWIRFISFSGNRSLFNLPYAQSDVVAYLFIIIHYLYIIYLYYLYYLYLARAVWRKKIILTVTKIYISPLERNAISPIGNCNAGPGQNFAKFSPENAVPLDRDTRSREWRSMTRVSAAGSHSPRARSSQSSLR